MKFQSNKPIYIQIRDYYESLIDSGAFKEGDEMPSVRDIAIMFGINPNTVQRALTLMVEDGYLRNIPKKGFYVNDVKINHKKIIKNAIDFLRESGVSDQEIIEYLKEEEKEK